VLSLEDLIPLTDDDKFLLGVTKLILEVFDLLLVPGIFDLVLGGVDSLLMLESIKVDLKFLVQFTPVITIFASSVDFDVDQSEVRFAVFELLSQDKQLMVTSVKL
jgi:hypothetical protein